MAYTPPYSVLCYNVTLNADQIGELLRPRRTREN